MSPIHKAVFPHADLCTCFHLATKSIPKEMLPVVHKPLIQYSVNETVQAAITDYIFLMASYKRTIEDHFDR